jgi:drug/metabolite transporter (DMT)-like permease
VDPATRRLLVLVQLCFGVFPILGKVALESFSPQAVLVWRLLAGSGVLFACAVVVHGRAAFPDLADLLRLFGLSLLGVIINQLLFLEGLSRSTAVNAGLLMTLIPVVTVVLSAMLGRERLSARRIAGLLLSVAGVGVLFGSRGAQLGDASTRLGDLLMTANAVSYAVYLVLAKPVLARLPQLVVVAWLFLFGALVVPWFTLGAHWVPAGAGARHWPALGGILLFPTVLAYMLNTIVLARTHAGTTAMYIMLQPLVAVALGIVLLGERPGPGIAVTAGCVLCGLWLVSGPGRFRTRADPR